MTTKIKVLSLKSSGNGMNLDKLEQGRIFGGLQANNSLTLFDNGSYSAVNFAYFETGDVNRIFNQFNAPPGTQITFTYQDNGNVINQVNAAGANTEVNLNAIVL